MTTFDELVALLEVGTLSPEERAEVGLQLAELGDMRSGVGIDTDGLPDIDWVGIPAGEFLMGSHLGDLTANVSEIPQTTVTLPTYYISRYPITYSQYEVFVSDGGYRNKLYWTKAGRKWRGRKTRPSAYWSRSTWHVGNHPIVGVTWYEAIAFCAWLSDKLGHPVRLPSESEWEKAARGTDGRRFPWGNQFYPQYANCGQTVQVDPFTRQMETVSIGRTTAVGIFPEGASPYGAMDMCGNVWEWCATAWRPSYDTPENNLVEGYSYRAIRGGSWSERETSARAAVRRGTAPETTSNNLGFRICTRPEGV